MHDHRQCAFWPMVSGLLIGAAAGATTMFFLSPRSGKANRQLVKRRVADATEYLQESKEVLEEKVQEIFGEVNVLTTSLFNDARRLWDTQVHTFEKSLDKIDKNHYQEMVDNVVEKLQVNKKYDNDNLAKIKRYLNSQWRKFNDMID